ncbi:MAG: sugar phosphate isomerase/epimerase [Clostridia bacterium]|nr:sugar phosphate isomerase/epimerase [Clostridia bacterium]
MEIGINIFDGISHEKQAEIFEKLGVKRTFIASETPDFGAVVALYRSHGVEVEAVHAPYNGINAMWGEEEEAAQKMLARLKDSIDKCAVHGIPVSVVHLSSGRPMPQINERGEHRYKELFDYAVQKGVTVALENQRYKENLCYFLEKYQSPGFCWDCGHEYGVTGRVGFMKMFGHRLAALHIHDNRCGVDTDDHLLPFDGNIDFEEVANLLAESGYQGTLMLEVGKLASIDGKPVYAHLSDEEYIQKAAEAARKIAQKI